MTWKKLVNVGDAATGLVKQLGTEKGRYGMQVHFRLENGDDIFVPEDVAYIWLEKCGFGTAENIEFNDVLGHTLRFERTAAPDGGRPHWKIERYAGSKVAVVPEVAAAIPLAPDSGSAHAVGTTTPATTTTVAPVARAASGTLNDHLPPARGNAPAPAAVMERGRDLRRADIVTAYGWALEAVIFAQLAAAKRHKTAPKPTAASIQEGVTTLMLRAERMNAI